MNIQAHSSTWSSQPHAVFFPQVKNSEPLLEDLEKDDTKVEHMEDVPDDNSSTKQGSENIAAENKLNNCSESEKERHF